MIFDQLPFEIIVAIVESCSIASVPHGTQGSSQSDSRSLGTFETVFRLRSVSHLLKEIADFVLRKTNLCTTNTLKKVSLKCEASKNNQKEVTIWVDTDAATMDDIENFARFLVQRNTVDWFYEGDPDSKYMDYRYCDPRRTNVTQHLASSNNDRIFLFASRHKLKRWQLKEPILSGESKIAKIFKHNDNDNDNDTWVFLNKHLLKS